MLSERTSSTNCCYVVRSGFDSMNTSHKASSKIPQGFHISPIFSMTPLERVMNQMESDFANPSTVIRIDMSDDKSFNF